MGKLNRYMGIMVLAVLAVVVYAGYTQGWFTKDESK
jgi:hypothetical protein